jgi:hypothetical protein
MRKKFFGLLILSLLVLGFNGIGHAASCDAAVYVNAYYNSTAITGGWLDTGLDLVAGEQLIIYASGIGCRSKDSPYCLGPDGEKNSPYNGCYAGELVGKIGAGTMICIGSSYNATVLQSGRLFLAYNDSDYLNNSGGFNVCINANQTPSSYDAGYAAGQAACKANPAGCGISVNPGTAVTLTPDFKMHLPNIQYNTILGTISIWADLAYDSTKSDATYFKVTGAGGN